MPRATGHGACLTFSRAEAPDGGGGGGGSDLTLLRRGDGEEGRADGWRGGVVNPGRPGTIHSMDGGGASSLRAGRAQYTRVLWVGGGHGCVRGDGGRGKQPLPGRRLGIRPGPGPDRTDSARANGRPSS